MSSAEPDLTLPPVHPDAPVVFPSVEFLVDVVFDDDERRRPLRWAAGRPLWSADEAGCATLTVTGPKGLLLPYLCGQLDSHHLFRGASVKGDVASLSALHGLTHHVDVERFWNARHDVVAAAVGITLDA